MAADESAVVAPPKPKPPVQAWGGSDFVAADESALDPQPQNNKQPSPAGVDGSDFVAPDDSAIEPTPATKKPAVLDSDFVEPDESAVLVPPKGRPQQ